MMISTTIIILSILCLIIISAFFSGSETALTAASKARIHLLEKKGNRRAKIVSKLIDIKERLIGSLLFGNNLVNILSSSLATSLFLTWFGEAGVVYATLTMTLLILIFAEILPKNLALAKPDHFALTVAPVVKYIVIIFSPFVKIINWIIRKILAMLGIAFASQESFFSAHDELRGALDLQHQEGSLVKDDRDRLGGVLDLHQMVVGDVMIHRVNMQALNLDDGSETLVQHILDSSYTRLPLWQNDPDNIIGIVHAKALLRNLSAVNWDTSKLNFSDAITAPWFVPETTNLQNQLNAFLRRKAHIALVIDEYGEVMGLVTLEDILEEIVGEISDEHDIVVQGIQQQTDGSILVDGSVSIRDLNRAVDWRLPDEEATTIAGLVLHEAKMIPDERQAFNFHGYRFVVLKKDKNRIAKLRISPLIKTLQTSS